MKLHRYLLVGLVTLAFALQGCEKDVENFDLSTTPLLVTTAFVSPQDTILTVDLQRTQPAIGKHLSMEQLKVPDATVTLSDGNNSVVLTYDAAWNKYYGPITSLPIVAGKTYFLNVSTPKGEKAEGTCTVPSRAEVRVTELNYETTSVVNYGYPMTSHKINFKWQDAPGVENYYHLTSYRTYHTTYYGYPPIVQAQHEPAYADNTKIYVADTKQDGKVMHSPEFSFSSSDPDYAPKPFYVSVLIAVTDKAYYQYHQTVLDQESNGGNPFAEPRTIYSNMRGSLGVFAAYNQIRVTRTIQ